MDKEFILQKIREYADTHQGKSPGQTVIETIYGIKKTYWLGKHWARWSDALDEAGLSANKMKTAYNSDRLISLYIEYIRKIGRLPVKAEFQIKSRNDKSFPNYNTFINQLGKKSEHAELLIRHCEKMSGYEDIIAICNSAIRSAPPRKPSETAPETSTISTVHGYVYLLKSGKRYKIGRTNQLDRRQYEIGLQLPEEIQPIHSIETDDPSGIEAYWHNHFKDKRLNGEWFNLTASDVKVFRKRKFM